MGKGVEGVGGGMGWQPGGGVGMEQGWAAHTVPCRIPACAPASIQGLCAPKGGMA